MVFRSFDEMGGVVPSGSARIRWSSSNRVEYVHALHHWLRLDELLVPGSQFCVELQARREATFDLPMFAAQREFVFTGNTDTVTDLAVGVNGDHGWVYGVIVVGAQPLPDPEGNDLHDAIVNVPDGPGGGWGVVPGGVPPDVLRDMFHGSFRAPIGTV
ncbi:MAG: hypothetical protein ACOH1Y_14820 [Propionicimonas sp.]